MDTQQVLGGLMAIRVALSLRRRVGKRSNEQLRAVCAAQEIIQAQALEIEQLKQQNAKLDELWQIASTRYE